jgi:ribonuclease-3
MDNLPQLQTKLGYEFTDSVYIVRALTHSSAHASSSGLDYERLEFLGDRVVNLVVADLLFTKFRTEKEGALAKRHTALVRTETLADIAIELSLGDFVQLSDAERRAGGAENKNILADLTEAVTAAIYLDGGFDAAKSFVEQALGSRLQDMVEPPRDSKTALQEWSQAQGLGLPVYDIVGQDGPDHAPDFTVRLIVEGYDAVDATSNSKKKAEKDAARRFLTQIGEL